MALSSVGGGYQIGDGNVNEVQMFVLSPNTVTATANLTAGQFTCGLLVGGNGVTPATYTIPTVAAIEAIVGNAKIDSAFELVVLNTGTGAGAALLATNAGWTIVGALTIAVNAAVRFIARKTGEGSWTLYRA
jgi:hypothetical protein